MADQKFTAGLSRSQGRSGWCLIFRHPLRVDQDGKPGLRMRRGLGTTDESQAKALIEQMNELLRDKTLWTPAGRSIAAKKYNEQIVAAFYDDLTPLAHDAWENRNKFIELPGPEQGFARVLILGTTGTGKTTLVRQFIGTDPEKERFPSTSTARTTTAEIEIVFDPGPMFRSVVTFLTKDMVRQYVEESVSAAVMTCLDHRPRAEVARRLLEHREQRFRLSYIIGTLSPQPSPERQSDDEDDFGDREGESSDGERGEVTDEERTQLISKLHFYLGEIEKLGQKAWEDLAGQLNYDSDKSSREDRDTFEELLEDHLSGQDDFEDLVDCIMDDLESRFELLASGELKRCRDGWPMYWTFECQNRDEFIKTANRFSSNYAPNFGRLLTPIVQGIRVAGPFSPAWANSSTPRLVLMDGEGLGHTPASAASISTKITKRFETANAIMLVDNATQPMQAVPLTVLRSLVTSGHESKLMICFTHFDLVRGDNLPDTQAKKAHVLGSVDNAIAAVGKDQGHIAEASLRKVLGNRVFFVSRIQEPLPERAKFTRSEMDRLLQALLLTVRQPEPTDFVPVYDDANLILVVQQAMQEFREPWRARLRLPSTAVIPAEHWSRIKALTRHIGQLGEDEYDSMRPVAELIARLQECIAGFLDKPLTWAQPLGEPSDDDVFVQATARVRQQVFKKLHDYVRGRVVVARLKEWLDAYSNHRGIGSTRERAHAIESIYTIAAPVPTGAAEPYANQFLSEIRNLVREAIHEGGGKLTSGDFGG